jgi:hypothetical protein
MRKLQKKDCTRLSAGSPAASRSKALGAGRKQRYTAGMKPIRSLILTAACLLSLAASAQWQWLDKDGRKVFSDLPPPSDVPQKNILKQPHQRSRTPEPMAAGDAAAPAAAEAATKPAGIDKGLQDKKKQADEAEAAKRKAEEERAAKVMAENCGRARQAKAGLDSGVRMSRINEKGEREFFDDGDRAVETQRLQDIINENCK